MSGICKQSTVSHEPISLKMICYLDPNWTADLHSQCLVLHRALQRREAAVWIAPELQKTGIKRQERLIPELKYAAWSDEAMHAMRTQDLQQDLRCQGESKGGSSREEGGTWPG